jgi:hypothetical protein
MRHARCKPSLPVVTATRALSLAFSPSSSLSQVGVIIGKAGVNIKIIEGKSRAKLNIHKPKVM